MSPNPLPVEVQCERCLFVIVKAPDTNCVQLGFAFTLAHAEACHERFMVKMELVEEIDDEPVLVTRVIGSIVL